MEMYPKIQDPNFRMALKVPPDDAVQRKVEETVKLLSHELATPLEVPPVVYDLKGTKAGQHTCRYYTNNPETTFDHKIRVNNDLLYTPAYEEMIQQTIPHEVAHAVAAQIYGAKVGHGYQWQRLMHLLGLPAKRCHSFEVEKARKRTKMDRPYIYTCACNRTYPLTQIVHRRILANKDPHRQYTCKFCRSAVRYVRTLT